MNDTSNMSLQGLEISFSNKYKNNKQNKDVTDVTNAETKKISVRVLTGSITQVRKWNFTLEAMAHFCVFEVIAQFIKIKSQSCSEISLLIRDRIGNDTFTVIYYFFPNPILPNLIPGTMIRCIGKMINESTFKAEKICVILQNELPCYERTSHVCKCTEIHK